MREEPGEPSRLLGEWADRVSLESVARVGAAREPAQDRQAAPDPKRPACDPPQECERRVRPKVPTLPPRRAGDGKSVVFRPAREPTPKAAPEALTGMTTVRFRPLDGFDETMVGPTVCTAVQFAQVLFKLAWFFFVSAKECAEHLEPWARRRFMHTAPPTRDEA